MSRPLWWRCKVRLFRPRRPGHCLGHAWSAQGVQGGGGGKGVGARAVATTAAAAAAAAAAPEVVFLAGSISNSGSGSNLSCGASSSSSSSIRCRVSPVTAGLLSCTFSLVPRRRLAFFRHGTVPQRGLVSKHAWLSLVQLVDLGRVAVVEHDLPEPRHRRPRSGSSSPHRPA